MSLSKMYNFISLCECCGGWECIDTQRANIESEPRYRPSTKQLQRELLAHPDHNYLAILALSTEEELR